MNCNLKAEGEREQEVYIPVRFCKQLVYTAKLVKQFKYAQAARANYLVHLLFAPNKLLVLLPEC